MQKKEESNLKQPKKDNRLLSSLSVDYHSEGTEMENVMVIMEKLLHWAAIIESSDDAIISKSIHGYITSWNRGAQRLYGYNPEEVIGKPVSILMPESNIDDFPMIMDQLQKGKKVDHYETKRKTKDGRIIDVAITVSPIRDSKGNIIGASKIARDISERMEYERRRDDFISAASHELKTPISTQKIYGELLERLIDKNADEEYKPYIRKINRQTEKLKKLVSDLLELSRVQTGRLSLNYEEFDIDELITEQVEDMQQVSGHTLTCRTAAGIQLRGDKERIGQVLINLLSNAIKYAPVASEIIITSQVAEGSVVIAVRDFGIGIPKEYAKKVFERFFRGTGTDESTYPGMGIGLNFCKEIIERHGGNIWVESEPGKGSTFALSLPLKKIEDLK